MAIVFFRVDERIIHGQVITRWLSEVDAQGIVAIDDQAANDPIISKVLKGAVPHGLKGFVMRLSVWLNVGTTLLVATKNTWWWRKRLRRSSG